MATLLQIDVSSRGDYSISRKLSAAFAETWKGKNAGGTVVHRDLNETELTFVDMNWIMGAYSTPDQHTPEHKKALQLSDTLIGEIMQADEVVIGTPMYNFSLPARLKAWVDHVVRVNKTFKTGENGYEGLVKGKKATFLIASAGEYGPGTPAESYNKEAEYLKLIFGFMGMTDSKVVLSGGTVAVMTGKVSQEEYLKPHVEQVAAAV